MRVCYFAMIEGASSLGVKKKISNIVDTFKAVGWAGDSLFFEVTGMRGYFKFAKALLFSDADLLILRNSLAMPIFFFLVLFKRIQGKRVVVDIPTPLATLREEILNSNLGFYFKFSRTVFLYLSFPWSLYSSSRVLQYAEESSFFKFGVRRKMKLTGNGISVNQISQKKIAAWPSKEFVLIAVGSLSDWHGFDRVIRGISIYKKNATSKVDIRFLIIGAGAARKGWESLVKELDVVENVTFLGPQVGTSLDRYFDQAHVAIASLGLYRKGLSMASDLKSREYTARGIPFVSSGEDIDFRPVPPFVFKVGNEDGEISIQSVISWYEEIGVLQDPAIIRNYAEDRLDFKVKIGDFLN